jgi:pimeloyl-ACP methyl ester carboxylesterase
LHRVVPPTLVIWGTDEPLGKPSVAKAAVERMPQARLQVLPGGHAPWLGDPAGTATIIEDFVRGEATPSD